MDFEMELVTPIAAEDLPFAAPLSLYRVYRPDDVEHDQLSGLVVAAVSEPMARYIDCRWGLNRPGGIWIRQSEPPGGYEDIWDQKDRESLDVHRIGVASPGIVPGVILRDVLHG